MWRYTTIPPNILQINSDISAVALQSATNATQLAILIGQQNGNNSGGTTFAQNFQTLPAGALPNPHWIVETEPNGTTGVYQPSTPRSSLDNSEGVNTGIAWFITDPTPLNAQARYYHRYDTPLMTDSVSLQFVVGSNGQSNQATIFFTHADSSMLNFNYVAIYNNRVFIGYGTRSVGAVYTFTDWLPATNLTVANGSLGEVRNQGTNWSLLINGATIVSFTDIAGNGFYNATHRYFGFILSQQNQFIAGLDRSFGVTSIVASDIAVPAVFGTGWQIARANATALAVAAGNNPCPAGTFDTTEFITQNVTLNNNAGEIIITKEGWYQLSWNYKLNTLSGNFPFNALLYFRPTVGGTQVLKRIGADIGQPANGVLQGGGFSSQISTALYLKAGNTIQPGIGVAGANNIIGNAGLTITFWTGIFSNA